MSDKDFIVDVRVNASQAKSEVEKVTDKVEELNKETKKLDTDTKNGLLNSLKEVSGGLGDLGGAGVGAFGKIADAVGMGSKAMTGFKAALISTGIGALVVAVGTLVVGFTRLQEGQDKLGRASAALGIIFNKLMDAVGHLAIRIVDAFENPQQAIADLWQALQDNILSRLEGVMNAFRALGTVISGALELDTDKITEGFGQFLDSTVQITTGIKNFREELGALSEEIGRAAEEAYKLEQRQQNLEKQEIKSIETTAKRNKEIARLRLLYEEEGRTLEEREEALRQAIALENANLEEQLRIAREQARIIEEQNALSESTREDLRREAEAKARVAELETQSLSRQKEITAQLRGLSEQRKALLEAEAKAQEEAAAKQIAAVEQLTNAIFDVQATAEEKEVDKVVQKYDKLRDLAAEYNLDTLELEEAYQIELQAIQEKFRLEREAAKQAEEDADDARRKAKTDKELADMQALRDAQLQMASQTIGALEGLAEIAFANDEKRARTAFNVTKALRIGEATAATWLAATNILADPTVPIPAKPFLVGATIAQGLANVAKIAATKFQPQGGGAAGGAGGGGGAPSLTGLDAAQPIQPPTITNVGAGAGQQVIQAYVIEQNVSNSQQANQRIKEVSAL